MHKQLFLPFMGGLFSLALFLFEAIDSPLEEGDGGE